MTQLGQVSMFESVPGRGLKCQVSGIETLVDGEVRNHRGIIYSITQAYLIFNLRILQD